MRVWLVELEVEQHVLLDERGQIRDAYPRLAIGECERFISTHHLRIFFHHFQACTRIWSEVGLVNDQNVRLGNAWAILPGESCHPRRQRTTLLAALVRVIDRFG